MTISQGSTVGTGGDKVALSTMSTYGDRGLTGHLRSYLALTPGPGLACPLFTDLWRGLVA